jgi:putative transposase
VLPFCRIVNEIIALLLHLLLRSAKFFKRSGARALLAENLLLKHQFPVLERSHRRAPYLHPFDRLLFGFWTSFLSPRRLLRAAVILKPSTLLRFDRLLRQCKHRFLYASRPKRKPGPGGPSPELIQAICEFKRRNQRFSCPRIAQHVVKTFGLEINKDVVRRVLARHYRPGRRDRGPSWLTFLGHAKESLWSLDLFRTESILLKSHWVLVIMDQFSRRIIGFGGQAVAVDGVALCRMFNQAISGQGLPVRLRLDHDPLFQSQRWQANLRILGIEVVQTVPLVLWSHPFVERLIRSIREEYLDQLFYWNATDLEQKLAEYRSYFNERRVHQGLGGNLLAEKDGGSVRLAADLADYGWQTQCHGLVQLPIAS